MRDIIFTELREANRVIGNFKRATKCVEGTELLIDTIDKVCQLSTIARREGLLALEDAAMQIEFPNSKWLKSMIMLIVDGTDPDLIEEMCTARYFSACLTGYEAVQYLIMMIGSLSIQAGQNPAMTEEKLLTLIPESVEEIYRNRKEEFAENIQSSSSEPDIVKQYYDGEIAVTLGDEYYFQIKVADYAIRSLDDRSIQRVLREVDTADLTLAMRGLSGDARRCLFNNLSGRLAIMIAEDMNHMGQARVRDVAQAITRIFTLIVKLITCGEIVSVDEEALRLFSKIFDLTEDEAMVQKVKEVENDLYRIMKEYSLASHKYI